MKRLKAQPKKEIPRANEWPGEIPYDDQDDEEFLDDIPLPNYAQPQERLPEPKRTGKRGKV